MEPLATNLQSLASAGGNDISRSGSETGHSYLTGGLLGWQTDPHNKRVKGKCQ